MASSKETTLLTIYANILLNHDENTKATSMSVRDSQSLFCLEKIHVWTNEWILFVISVKNDYSDMEVFLNEVSLTEKNEAKADQKLADPHDYSK